MTIEQALAVAASMGLTQAQLLEKATGAKAPAPAPASAGGPVQQKGANAGGGEITKSWLSGVWSSVKSFFAGKAADPTPAASSPEEIAKAEDAAAFHDIDGQIDKFVTAAATKTYFDATSPGKWKAAQPDHTNIMKVSNQQGISAAEVNALVGYTGPAYSPMNRFTRGQMKSDYFKQVFGGYCGLAGSALGKLGDGQVKSSQRGWRTVPNGDAGLIEGLYNREYVDEAGFMSTTANSDQSMFEGQFRCRSAPSQASISATSPGTNRKARFSSPRGPASR
jgi:hypothetical protein